MLENKPGTASQASVHSGSGLGNLCNGMHCLVGNVHGVWGKPCR